MGDVKRDEKEEERKVGGEKGEGRGCGGGLSVEFYGNAPYWTRDLVTQL